MRVITWFCLVSTPAYRTLWFQMHDATICCSLKASRSTMVWRKFNVILIMILMLFFAPIWEKSWSVKVQHRRAKATSRAQQTDARLETVKSNSCYFAGFKPQWSSTEAWQKSLVYENKAFTIFFWFKISSLFHGKHRSRSILLNCLYYINWHEPSFQKVNRPACGCGVLFYLDHPRVVFAPSD